MKNACCMFLLVFTFSQSASASPIPILNGTWVLNQINEKAVNGDIRVSLTRKGNEFLVQRDRSPIKLKYIVDGTKRKLPQIGTLLVTYSTAKWEEESLITDKTSDAPPLPNGIKAPSMYTHEVWSISADGRSLTCMTTYGKTQNKIEFTAAYTKADTQ